MSFYEKLSDYKQELKRFMDIPISGEHIRRAIHSPRLKPFDFWALLSPQADAYLEEMARVAREISRRHFGKTVLLFTPLYLSNYCTNQCIYCGFNTSNRIHRSKLTLEEVEREAKAIAATGLKHILILTGESRQQSPVSYIEECVSVLKKYFSSISIEIYPLTTDEYAELIAAGVDGLTMFQEVYNEPLYLELHPAGPKRDFRFRLEAPERAGTAGMRTIGIGALLGLDDWRTESFFTGIHADYLQQRFPEVEMSVSLPRMRPHAGSYRPASPVSERGLVQIMLALRLFLPRVGITISTRERQGLRDNLVGLGVTKLSAGVSTSVGGHVVNHDDVGQFEISDPRSVDEVRQAMIQMGYKPILKDWHPLESGA